MDPHEGFVVDSPRVVVPRLLGAQGCRVDVQLGGHDATERLLVVTTDTVKVDAENEGAIVIGTAEFVVVMEDLGHFVHIEQPELVADIVLDFVGAPDIAAAGARP